MIVSSPITLYFHESHYLTGHNIQNVTHGEDPPDTNSAAPSDDSGFFTANSVASHLDNGDPRMDLIQRINSLCAGGLRAGSDADGILGKVVHYVKLAESLLPHKNGVNVDLNRLTWKLHQSSRDGDDVAVQMLLSRDDIDPNSIHIGGVTPLMEAAMNGHEAVVWQLLGRKGVDPGICTSWKWTALIFAADNGHDAVVRLLLERDNVHVDSALWKGAAEGHGMVVQLLLEQIKPESKDHALRMALFSATDRGHELTIRRALGFEGINLDPRCSGLLFQAAKDGNHDAVRVLLSRYHLDPSSRTLFG
jgi:hypothetical protein